MSDPKDPSIARNLGSFFGHIVRAIKTGTDDQERVASTKVTKEEREIDGVILRRTTIDEVVLPTDPPTPDKPT